MPGGAILTATAALRSGAGKVVIATPASIAADIALAVPESRTVAMPETKCGGLAGRGLAIAEDLIANAHVVVAGPGLMQEQRSCAFLRALLPSLTAHTVLLDALAMGILKDGELTPETILTPHAGEMAHLTGLPKELVSENPLKVATEASRRWNCVVALKGPVTIVCGPDGSTWKFSGGSPGLGTAGSGDTLAGLIGGLAARGAVPMQATLWGVATHGRAGRRLGTRIGALGYLARELLDEIPRALEDLQKPA